jgi:hypothetical protein
MRGFLIVVIMALLVIVAIYTGFFNKKKSVVHQIIHANQKAEIMQFETDIQHITTAINSFFFDRDQMPESLSELIPDYLRTENEYLDPWGTPYRIDIQDENNMIIISAGEDKIFETSDDMKRRLK